MQVVWIVLCSFLILIFQSNMNNLADFWFFFIYHKSQISSDINDMYDAHDTKNYCICSHNIVYIWLFNIEFFLYIYKGNV